MTTIVIDDPVIEAAITNAATAAGIPVESLVHDVLAERFSATSPSFEQLSRILAEIAETGRDTAPIPLDQLSREKMYE